MAEQHSTSIGQPEEKVSLSLSMTDTQQPAERYGEHKSKIQRNVKSSIKYMDTEAAYNLWAEVYDTDGNFLQALDSDEMKTLLPEFMQVPFTSSETSNPRTISPWKVADLGCGTGRITMELLEYPQAEIYGLDVSEQMLKIAKEKTTAKWEHTIGNDIMRVKPVFSVFDAMKASTAECPVRGADSVVSSLVIEHLALGKFFAVAKTLLKPSGTLLLTNMHADMGAISQAGFVDPKTGLKVRPQSHIHTISQVLEEATKAGFKRIGDIRERDVTEEMVQHLGVRARKWIGVKVWFSIYFQCI